MHVTRFMMRQRDLAFIGVASSLPDGVLMTNPFAVSCIRSGSAAASCA